MGLLVGYFFLTDVSFSGISERAESQLDIYQAPLTGKPLRYLYILVGWIILSKRLSKGGIMVSFTELNHQNDTITELSNVLGLLIDERAIWDTRVVSNLFFVYVDKVKEHLDLEERELYQPLLLHSDQRVRQTANKFLSGSGEIKRVFGQYLRRWSRSRGLRINDHDQFARDTREMFQLVLNRIEDEVEHLYPTVREVRAAATAA